MKTVQKRHWPGCMVSPQKSATDLSCFLCLLRRHPPPAGRAVEKRSWVCKVFMTALYDCTIKRHCYVSRKSEKDSRFQVLCGLWLSTSSNISSIFLCTFLLELFPHNDCSSSSYLVLAQRFRSPSTDRIF